MPVVRFTDVASRMFGILTACLALAIMYTSNDLIRDNKPSPASRGVPEPEGAWFHTNEIWDGEWLSENKGISRLVATPLLPERPGWSLKPHTSARIVSKTTLA